MVENVVGSPYFLSSDDFATAVPATSQRKLGLSPWYRDGDIVCLGPRLVLLWVWGGFFAGHGLPPTFVLDPVSWHAHEMIFGFTMAIVAGFLLTAVANWTGGAPVRQIHLAGLCALWLAGRVVMNFDLGLSEIAVIVVEGAFILTLAFSLAIPLLKSWNKRNFGFLVLLSILFAFDMTFFIT